ncbi:MAG: formylglycine-generating enzyme family protein [Verrucomicrobiales bacterium]|nr:formylglycine-generating enzyme family protein [Verrucomicrobiales bacterium]
MNIELDLTEGRRWNRSLPTVQGLGALLALLSTAGWLGCGKPAETQEAGGPKPETQPMTALTPAISKEPATKPVDVTPPAAPADMVLMARGTFTMGDKDEVDAAPHEVTVSPFFIDKNLVTQQQYEKAMGDNPSRWKGEKNPVEQVRWSDAVRYCNKRSELEGLEPCYDLKTWACRFEATGYRLPTEAEWEYACRAGTTTRYFFGDSPAKLGTYAWFDKNAGGRPRPVGQKQPNSWGLYDMSGNVWQWCNDFYQVDYYATSPKEDPRGPESGDKKVVRGGAWRFGAETCKSGYRYNESPGYADVCFGYDIYGFRCVRKAK